MFNSLASHQRTCRFFLKICLLKSSSWVQVVSRRLLWISKEPRYNRNGGSHKCYIPALYVLAGKDITEAQTQGMLAVSLGAHHRPECYLGKYFSRILMYRLCGWQTVRYLGLRCFWKIFFGSLNVRFVAVQQQQQQQQQKEVDLVRNDGVMMMGCNHAAQL